MLLGGLRKGRQFGDVRRLMLEDDRRIELFGQSRDAVARSDRFGPARIEIRHRASQRVGMAEPQIPRQDHRCRCKLHQERGVTGRMSVSHDNGHPTVAEYVVIFCQRNDGRISVYPRLDVGRRSSGRRRTALQHRLLFSTAKSPAPISSFAFGNCVAWPVWSP